MRSSDEIRKAFLQFFEDKGHSRLESGPLVPANDPTLMFAAAGMVQFKDVFTGLDKRAYTRATTSQKCIRISGKHNDLENVGVTARHHTFFEMLGNFSFGDYFKREAIEFAWTFLTDILQIPQEKLLISIFGGEDGVAADEEAARLWHEVAGLGPERIARCGKKDNFWQAGDTGPCGPCSEIHYWTGDGDPVWSDFGVEPGADGKGWVELWNLVFMQFVQHEDGTLTDLPAPSIDTGAGLERLSAVCQGVLSNYDTDLLRPIVDLASKISGKAYGGTLGDDDVSMRVIADHARTTAFMISEGIFPDKDGRSYVLRRVMRRAIRHGERLGISELFFHEAALAVVDTMGEAYPQLVERRELIEDLSRQEETRFRKTLRRGLRLLEGNDTWEQEAENKTLPAKVSFTLYDTYGFPLDLQQVIGAERGFAIDEEGFARCMDEARKTSQASSLDAGEAIGELFHTLAQELPDNQFTGYDNELGKGVVLALVRKGRRVERLEEGQEGGVFVDATPFYGESGGQTGDRGWFLWGTGGFEVEDTQKPRPGLIVHRGKVSTGALSVGQELELKVDPALRRQTRCNHSATHLLHWALRTVLGPQAMQKGSLVSPERLRFDYASAKPLSRAQITEIECLVNAKISVNAPIETEVLPMDEAKAKGAIGIFEEKYGAVVRMLRVTDDSIELCGGTHAQRTGDIGLFKILSEGGLAAGVRRIEARTGARALTLVHAQEEELGQAAVLLKAKAGELPEKVTRLLARQKELQKEITALQRELLDGPQSGGAELEVTKVGDVSLLAQVVSIGDPKALREHADKLRDQHAPAVILLGAQAGKKAVLACSVSKAITDRYHAGKIVKAAAAVVGGGGGGRPDFAQAGGSDPSKLEQAMQTLYPAG